MPEKRSTFNAHPFLRRHDADTRQLLSYSYDVRAALQVEIDGRARANY
jgi:hypothetical protein